MKVKITEIKTNPDNPRLIKDNKFKKLVQSIKEFPEMLEKRPIVVDENMMILGGNMRFKASQELGLKELYVIKAEGWTDKQKKQFVIKDNVSAGDWDWDVLANTWENQQLNDWGLQVWQQDDNIDYSVLDDIDVEKELDTMYQQTKKSIILEYPSEMFEPVKKLYDKLKSNNTDMSDLFHKAMQNYDS